MTLTQPTKSTRAWLAKHDAIVSDLKRLAKANGVRIPRHSKAYLRGATVKLSEKGMG